MAPQLPTVTVSGRERLRWALTNSARVGIQVLLLDAGWAFALTLLAKIAHLLSAFDRPRLLRLVAVMLPWVLDILVRLHALVRVRVRVLVVFVIS